MSVEPLRRDAFKLLIMSFCIYPGQFDGRNHQIIQRTVYKHNTMPGSFTGNNSFRLAPILLFTFF
jgi:hypothetical protein